jgi:uncharacterized ferritin-like protein (DUF455 family)
MKPELFQICIRILEARHLTSWPGIDTQVRVQVDKEKQYTEVKKSTDRPYYNEVKILVYIFKDNRSHVGFAVLTEFYLYNHCCENRKTYDILLFCVHNA